VKLNSVHNNLLLELFMFIRVPMLICTFVFALNVPAFSMQALTVKSEDVYRAAFCAELNRLAQYPKVSYQKPEARLAIRHSKPSQHENPISDAAYKLITGGDNLEFVDIGIADAKREYLKLRETPTVKWSSSTMQKCADKLATIIQRYEWMPCGYGRNRRGDITEINPYLQRLEIYIEPVSYADGEID
jgi:hypothetical protein